jgi:hypothetical protein
MVDCLLGLHRLMIACAEGCEEAQGAGEEKLRTRFVSPYPTVWRKASLHGFRG